MVFLYLEKAFDKVPHELIWYALRSRGVPEIYINWVKLLYRDASNTVRTLIGTPLPFAIRVAVHQGSALSSLLFVLCMVVVTADLQRPHPWTLLYADDVFLLDEDRGDVQGQTQQWKTRMGDNDITLNFIPDRSRPELTTTAIGSVDLQGAGGNWATVGRRSRGGSRVHRQREKRKGVVLKEEFVRNVLEVKRVSDRVMSLKLEIEGVMLNVVSGYAPQVGCELEEKERFWSELDEVMESIPMGERVVIGADFNGHVGEGNRGDEEVMGKSGVKETNLEGQMVVDFAKRMDMAVVNTYFQKREEHRVTYKSGGRRTQVEYILCRRGNLKEISDCKVVVGESVARQHRMVVCRMTLMVCKTKRSKIEIGKKTKWWKLKKEECCEEFRQKLRQALGGQVVLPDDWEATAEGIRETGRKVLGVSSGRRKEDKETWWWNEEVQDSVQRKRLAKKKWDMDRTEENRQEYKE
ncbi:hypothetical protein QTP70_032759 [Hemibagrus guttatus]|uniref:Reverse transcriptase domain-containing protein n=1 Tax=Hemibagrus guttatus TaxID=175788 RepID=A0AAE0V648_9TELE|nr:hypothetical protein QTP70_032759 [Hemibagrus guttatus]